MLDILYCSKPSVYARDDDREIIYLEILGCRKGTGEQQGARFTSIDTNPDEELRKAERDECA